MIYITGDTHGRFTRIFEFCRNNHTTKDDILIILGDAGINYYGDIRDVINKSRLAELPITLFCIHGNHEMRPQNIDSYRPRYFCDGIVYSEQEYPNILFAVDAQIYSFDGSSCLVIGGAYSIDKQYRISRGLKWFSDEQPDEATKQLVEMQCKSRLIDVVLSHTCPFKYMPTEAFLPGIDQSFVDNGTERWLDSVEESMTYEKWYCGHYHIDKSIDRMRFMFNDIVAFEGGVRDE